MNKYRRRKRSSRNKFGEYSVRPIPQLPDSARPDFAHGVPGCRGWFTIDSVEHDDRVELRLWIHEPQIRIDRFHFEPEVNFPNGSRRPTRVTWGSLREGEFIYPGSIQLWTGGDCELVVSVPAAPESGFYDYDPEWIAGKGEESADAHSIVRMVVEGDGGEITFVVWTTTEEGKVICEFRC